MILQKIRERAAADTQHIVLPEGEDVRTLQAAEMCVRDRVAKITVIGNEEKVRALAGDSSVNLNGVEILDHRKSSEFGRIASLYHEPALSLLRDGILYVSRDQAEETRRFSH